MKKDKQDSNAKIVIEGVTQDGESFRPSDWAERMSGTLSTFRNHRIFYSPLLRPSIQNEHKCLVLDKSLKNTNPALYEHILEFAHKNKLKICGEED
ncbi:MAG TPA: DUF3579 domain-containing protein [Gammaproteobacteria bacterium]|nr:DUF3579 domain-containing protein [Gammaproteobacteria bacterium]HQZ87576.1 DUF3579 domain-containing protein [Gammaproteobacteria bacterium]HRA42430.1 DUF3579 domain-containing protein [Gammaproteobacteria bacterium]